LDFIGAKDDGTGSRLATGATRRAKLKSNCPPTNQHPASYRLDALLTPSQQLKSTEGKENSEVNLTDNWFAPQCFVSTLYHHVYPLQQKPKWLSK